MLNVFQPKSNRKTSLLSFSLSNCDTLKKFSNLEYVDQYIFTLFLSCTMQAFHASRLSGD